MCNGLGGGPLSLGERAGVRGNWPCSSLTSQAIAGTVKFFNYSGRARVLPSGIEAAPIAGAHGGPYFMHQAGKSKMLPWSLDD